MKMEGLNFLEALQAAKDGFFINFGGFCYCYNNEKDILKFTGKTTKRTETAVFTVSEMMSTHWGIGVRTMSFIDALSHFNDGKKIRRASWDTHRFLVKHPETDKAKMDSVLYDDIIADDWYYVIND